MKILLKRAIVGTVLEPFARKIYGVLRQPSEIATSFGTVTEAAIIDKNHLYDLQTLDIMRRVLREDSNCVDVGCHQGSILKEMLHLAPNGRHFAFEPIPGMYRDLYATFGGYANVRLYECALSDAPGMTSFQHVVSNPGYSGLRRRRYDQPHEDVKEITVQTERLDDLLPKDMTIHFVKVDVEGAELQVFKGAAETIRTSRPVVVFEHGLGAADYYGTKPEIIYDFLVKECGLKTFIMGEWLASNGQRDLSRSAFCEHFATGQDYYFMAAP